MGTLVLDIETASPFDEPPENANETEHYEWVAVGLAYADELDETPETEVLFRRGDWDDTYTADLFERLFEWCDRRAVDRVLTYNGTWFDGKHLLNWAEELDASTDREFRRRVETLFENHVDVALAAADEYADELWEDQYILPDWKAYDLAGIDNDSVWYDNYDFPDVYLSEIDGPAVQGEHVGRVLGARYVENVSVGIEATSVHRELARLLEDYSESDVADLIELYAALGGPALDETYRRTAEEMR
jgi:DNA polymerase elongation subunit (family B)